MLHLTTKQLETINGALLLAARKAPQEHRQDILDARQVIEGEIIKRRMTSGIDPSLLKATTFQPIDPLIVDMERHTPRCRCCGVMHEGLVRGLCSYCHDEQGAS